MRTLYLFDSMEGSRKISRKTMKIDGKRKKIMELLLAKASMSAAVHSDMWMSDHE